MAALFYSTQFCPIRSSFSLSASHVCEAYRKPCLLHFIRSSRNLTSSPFTYELRRDVATLRSHSCTRLTCIRATSSDLGDPEELNRLEVDHFVGAGFEGAGDVSGSYAGESLGEPQVFVEEKFEATSQLNESVQSRSTDEIEVAEGGGGGDIKSGGDGGSWGNGEDGEGESDDKKKKMSVSQKLTLAYAALVGVGGLIGYAKSKSSKSLTSGVVSSLVLCHVSTQLPTNPVYASIIGLGVSALLLTVMGIRFKKSGKFFPAGIVSLVSLIMTGGYLHGIMRTSHI